MLKRIPCDICSVLQFGCGLDRMTGHNAMPLWRSVRHDYWSHCYNGRIQKASNCLCNIDHQNFEGNKCLFHYCFRVISKFTEPTLSTIYFVILQQCIHTLAPLVMRCTKCPEPVTTARVQLHFHELMHIHTSNIKIFFVAMISIIICYPFGIWN